jgi:hypothetical protein
MDYTYLQENFPFLSGVRHRGIDYVGIVQNHDEKILSFYDFDDINTPDEKRVFLDLGDTWWWESNRLLPINIFLISGMKPFRYCLKTIAVKETEIMFGPVTSLNNLIKKRTKRKQIQLIRKT